MSGNEQIGGLVGNNSGVIRSCINNGAVGYQHMGYNIGGIAGDSDTMIRNCSTKSVLAGDTYVGGIAGKGNEVTGCYAFVDIKAYTEKAGAILGNANELPDGIEDVITGNKYFAFEKAVGGIDGIIYENATEPLALFLTQE